MAQTLLFNFKYECYHFSYGKIFCEPYGPYHMEKIWFIWNGPYDMESIMFFQIFSNEIFSLHWIQSALGPLCQIHIPQYHIQEWNVNSFEWEKWVILFSNSWNQESSDHCRSDKTVRFIRVQQRICQNYFQDKLHAFKPGQEEMIKLFWAWKFSYNSNKRIFNIFRIFSFAGYKLLSITGQFTGSEWSKNSEGMDWRSYWSIWNSSNTPSVNRQYPIDSTFRKVESVI